MKGDSYFSLGRHALLTGLATSGVNKGEVVAVPKLMCAEVVSALRESGYLIKYFDVTFGLSIESFPNEIHAASAILAVNYFGFPCDLTPFTAIAMANDCVVIEDNAHGWLSSDEFGRPLGSRTGVGFTSFRKSIRVVDGAILHLDNSLFHKVNPLTPSNMALLLGFRVRQLCSKTEEVLHIPLMNVGRAGSRFVRRLVDKDLDPHSAVSEHEHIMGIHKSSLEKLSLTNIHHERARRRHLFTRCLTISKPLDAEPVFKELPQYVVPLGFPFYGDSRVAETFARKVFRLGLEVFRWPALPTDIAGDSLPDHYRSMWLVNFLR